MHSSYVLLFLSGLFDFLVSFYKRAGQSPLPPLLCNYPKQCSALSALIYSLYMLFHLYHVYPYVAAALMAACNATSVLHLSKGVK